MNNLKRTLIHGLEHGIKIHQVSKPSFLNQPNYEEVIELTIFNLPQFIRSGKKKSYRIISQKPYLFPLSDLTKEIEIGGERFVPKEWLRMNYIGESIGLNPATWSHRTIDKLCEWHFNCFNLSPDEFIEVDETNNPYR